MASVKIGSGQGHWAPLLNIRTEGGRLLAKLPRQSLDVDFTVLLSESAFEPQVAGPPAPDGRHVAWSWLSPDALRWVAQRDSVILLQYWPAQTGKAGYRRAAAFPILRHAAGGALIIDAGVVLSHLERVAMPPERALVEHLSAGEYQPLDTMTFPSAPGATSRGARQTASRPTEVSFTLSREVRVARHGGKQWLSQGWTFLRLPKTPMRPRLWSSRLNYMSTRLPGRSENYVQRWRLEKRDPNAAVSDVVRPVIYRIDPSVPEQWVPWIKRGIEEWTPLFEAIGFRHAIVVRDPSSAPAKSVDTPETLIRWDQDDTTDAAKGTGAETGDLIPDPRSGEILRWTVTLHASLLGRAMVQAFVWTSALDPRIRYPWPEDARGRLVQLVVAHEVGHSLGMDHRFNWAAAYPTDSIRSAAFVHRMGYTSSVVTYAYSDYVSQPEDHITLDDLYLRVGSYDAWALAWGYRPIAGAKTPEEELPTLQRWLTAQDTAPYLRGSRGDSDSDSAITAVEPAVVGDDPVKAADYGIRNLARVASVIDSMRAAPAPAPQSKGRNDVLQRMVLDQWGQELSAAIHDVGRVVPRKPDSATSVNAPPLPEDSARQVRALRFFMDHVLYGRDDLLRRHVLAEGVRRDTASVVLFDAVAPGWGLEQWEGRWQPIQQHLLAQLLEETGLAAAAGHPAAPYTNVLPAFCAELRALDRHLAELRPATPSGVAQRGALRDALAEVLQATPRLCP